MTTLREAAQQALEALGLWATGRDIDAVALNDLIFRLEAALAEPVQEPVAWMDIDADGNRLSVRQWSDGNREEVPLYMAPPQRKPLTEEQVERAYSEIWRDSPDDFGPTAGDWIEAGIRYAERVHGIIESAVKEDKAPHPEDYEIAVLCQQIAAYQAALHEAFRRKHGSQG